MLKRIGLAGLAAGAISGGFLFAMMVAFKGVPLEDNQLGALLGYASMLVALSFVFIAVKRQRDVVQGGVIKFLPAFGMGLAISAIAGIIYALCWEVTLAVTGLDFGDSYAQASIRMAEAQGMSGAELEAYTARMEGFAKMYANPVFRIPMTFTEIFPVGALVSLVSALLLRNSRFLPYRPTI
ncbi:MAG: DUF4199 domain-containing protein [Hyphomonas sp.]|nr:DUF4199 domain-containing protein [Hyphomonas sp.]